MKKSISRHVVMVSDKVWEDARVKAIRKHITLAQFIEEAIDEKVNRVIINLTAKERKLIDSKKEKKIN